MTTDYQAIVIGSGLGGLSAAAALARSGVRVKLLEQHTQPGGYATTFFRDRFEFEVSLHALSGIGEPGDRGPLWHQLEALDVARRVEFIPLPDLYRTVGPGLDVTAPKGAEAFVAALGAAFPHEARGIARLVEQVRTIGYEVDLLRAGGYSTATLPTLARFPHLAHAAGVPVSTFLDRELTDPAAKLAFTQLWGYFGLPPSELSMLMFAVGMNAYLRYGSTAIRGKSQSLSDAFVDVVREAGGEATFGTAVRRILVADGRVRGVETATGERLTADAVISNADPLTTTTRLLAPQDVPTGFARQLETLPASVSIVSVYLGLDKPSRELGIEDYEVYFNADLDLEGHYASTRSLDAPRSVSMCAYDLINPNAAPAGAGVVVLSALADGRAWERLAPEEYPAAKRRFAARMLEQVERLYPALARHVETASVSTPITNMRYTGNPHGAIYGFANTPELNPGFRPANRGPLPGLWFAGAWARPGGGFQATITSGINAAAEVLAERQAAGAQLHPVVPVPRPLPPAPPRAGTRKLRGLGLILRDGRRVKQTIDAKSSRLPDDPTWSPAEPPVARVVERFHSTRQPVVLIERITETPETTTLRFAAVGGELPPFEAGQYFSVYVEQDGAWVGRPYSASSPANARFLEITVKGHLDGYVSHRLSQTLAVGDTVLITGPNGDFFHNPLRDSDRLVGVAVGSGITPFMSMIEELDRSLRRVELTLFYGSRRPGDVIFRERLEHLAATRDWLTVIPVLSRPPEDWSGARGRISGELVRRHLGPGTLHDRTFFVCGPRELYRGLVADLEALGVPRGRIRLEAYGPPADVTAEPDWPSELSGREEFQVRLPGRAEPVTVVSGAPLLQSLERAGVAHAALCRSGSCDVCKVKLAAGDVYTPADELGLRAGGGAGYIQPCMCYPKSDLRLVG